MGYGDGRRRGGIKGDILTVTGMESVKILAVGKGMNPSRADIFLENKFSCCFDGLRGFPSSKFAF